MATHDAAYGHELRHGIADIRLSLSEARRECFWLDDDRRPEQRSRLTENKAADLVVVGAGYCGLWTAIIAKERDPGRRVVVLEGERIGGAASGRNGGFVEADLTHGPENGRLHFAAELDTLDRLGAENFAAMEATIARYGIDASWERAPMLTVATEPHQVEALRQSHAARVLQDRELASLADSPLYRAGILESEGHAYVNPARLAWGLADAAESLGVEIHEHSPVLSIRHVDGRRRARTPQGEIDAAAVALATNGYPSLLPHLRFFTVPIYDYVLMTEPLTPAQLRSIGWTGRHGITDSGREFHYYRKTDDDRILFGGYDAVYHRGGRVRAEHQQRDKTFERLADHFFSTFPQLRDVRFSHRWGGMIDMSTRLVAHHGTSRDGTVAFSAGYTGLGVAATRFGAETMLDLLDRKDTERTRLKMSRSLPFPIPPEPIANPLIQLMRRAVARSDARGGRDGLLLRLAGLFGIGFDS
ncbi:putative oxidoreductase ordL [Microbacterium sp. HM58-2]|nr:putative oxidoreductase ordL [Microbacterium sp. HM58-2]